MNVKTCDLVLVKHTKGFSGVLSNLICWWLNSEYSHCLPVISESGYVLNAGYPNIDISHLSFYERDCKMIILRPTWSLSDEDINNYMKSIYWLKGCRYDLLSYLGFLSNKKIQDMDSYNCAEAALFCYRSMNRFLSYDGRYVSPQTFIDFAHAGVFSIVKYRRQGE